MGSIGKVRATDENGFYKYGCVNGSLKMRSYR